MKQIILLSFFLLANLGFVKAQDYDITPNDITLDTIVDLSDAWTSGKMHSELFNNTSGEVELWWKITQTSGPSEWQPQLCVNNESGGCFSWDILSNAAEALPNPIPLTIQANDHSIFDIGVRPKSVAGCGTYEIKVTPMNDTTDVLITGVYNFRFNVDANCAPLDPVATNDFDKSSVKIFPNPTTDYFTITDNPYVESIQIFNIVGKQMAMIPFQNGNTINVANFPNGLYLVRMLDDDGDVLKTTRLTKR